MAAILRGDMKRIRPGVREASSGPAQRCAHHCLGMSLIEVLISVFVLSIGLLGYAGLVLKAQQASYAAYARSQATLLAHDLLERLRANRALALAGGYNVAMGASLAEGMPGIDVSDWKANIAQSLPGGDGAVSVDPQGGVRLTVQWREGDRAEPTAFAIASRL